MQSFAANPRLVVASLNHAQTHPSRGCGIRLLQVNEICQPGRVNRGHRSGVCFQTGSSCCILTHSLAAAHVVRWGLALATGPLSAWGTAVQILEHASLLSTIWTLAGKEHQRAMFLDGKAWKYDRCPPQRSAVAVTVPYRCKSIIVMYPLPLPYPPPPMVTAVPPDHRWLGAAGSKAHPLPRAATDAAASRSFWPHGGQECALPPGG